jgi:hypothetical protein
MRALVVALLVVLSTQCLADDELIDRLAPGQYILVGKAYDSQATYTGKVVIEAAEKAFNVTRHVAGKTLSGVGKAASAAGGDSRVLRISFTDAGVQYEQTCLVASDLDNYGRISCYTYRPGQETQNPGLEVLFIDHSAG